MTRFWSLLVGSSLATSIATADESTLIERGRYLATLAACHDCHTPKSFGSAGMEFDETRLLSGHPEGATLAELPAELANGGQVFFGNEHFTAWTGPWGTSFARNLTPDEDTGIGTWSREMFVKAMRTGRHMGEGREILPPMPWQNLSIATDEDLHALFAYLRSLPPVSNVVPEPLPPAARPN